MIGAGLMQKRASGSKSINASVVSAAAAVDTSKSPKSQGFTMPGALMQSCRSKCKCTSKGHYCKPIKDIHALFASDAFCGQDNSRLSQHIAINEAPDDGNSSSALVNLL